MPGIKVVFGGQTYVGLVPDDGVAGTGVVAGGTCCVFGGEAGVTGQGLRSGVAPVISESDAGMSQKFLFFWHASAFAFFSIQLCLRGGAGAALTQGAVGVVAGWACADAG